VEPENISARMGAMNQSARAGEILIFIVVDAFALYTRDRDILP
jgi:hypothetical protein